MAAKTPKTLRITFRLDQSDVAHFHKLFREAKRNVNPADRARIIREVGATIQTVRAKRTLPKLVRETTDTLETLIQMLEDESYALPHPVESEVLASLAYFSDAEDLVPDHIPGLGFLDDAIMVKFVEHELGDEISAYRKFRRFREGAEQRPWTSVARQRLPERLERERRRLRAGIEQRRRSG